MQNELDKLSIFITENVNEKIKEVLSRKNYSKVAVIVDENTREKCYPLIKDELPDHTIIEVTSGEENKNLITCQSIWQGLTNDAFDRKSIVINLGGGVIGDMGGFCASTYKRGIDFFQIPTTLLSQVDASVGGKLGVDFNIFKNHIGLFCVPQAVLISSNFLKTLPEEEIRSGYAEIIKHCLIADANKWEEIKNLSLNQLDYLDLIEHSVKIKGRITEEDPTEKGLRKILNFGHTIGHAIESYFLGIPGEKFLHGEAIAIGMICEAYVSRQKGYISDEEVESIKKYIISIYGHHKIQKVDIDALIPLTIQDKKNSNNVVFAALLKNIGEANFDQELSVKDVEDSIAYYNS